MNARPEAWLRQAENDLELARLAHQNCYFAQACFFASQAAEKALKGALLELDVEPPHTHVLPDLVAALGRCGLDVQQLKLCRCEPSAVWRSALAIHWMPRHHRNCLMRRKRTMPLPLPPQ
jgi:HEPN domain-containing protein